RERYVRRTYDFDDTTPRRALGISGPVVSPDGQFVAFSALGDIYLKDMLGGTVERVTSGAGVSLDPDWSPDGRTLLYVSDRVGTMDLWKYTLEDGAAERLLPGTADEPLSMPSWSPDGT